MKFNQIIFNLKVGVSDTLSTSKRWIAFLLLSVFIFSLFVLIPVWTTPGNDILFQLTVFKADVYILMIILALFNSLLIVMQYHVRQKAKIKVGGKHAVTGFGIVTASIASTLACASCYSSVLAIFGLGGTIFIVEHRWWFAVFAFSLTFVALVYTSKTIAQGCKACGIPLIE